MEFQTDNVWIQDLQLAAGNPQAVVTRHYGDINDSDFEMFLEVWTWTNGEWTSSNALRAGDLGGKLFFRARAEQTQIFVGVASETETTLRVLELSEGELREVGVPRVGAGLFETTTVEDNVYVAFVLDDNVQVGTLSFGAWNPIVSPSAVVDDSSDFGPSLVAVENELVLAYQTAQGTESFRFDGSSWEPLNAPAMLSSPGALLFEAGVNVWAYVLEDFMTWTVLRLRPSTSTWSVLRADVAVGDTCCVIAVANEIELIAGWDPRFEISVVGPFVDQTISGPVGVRMNPANAIMAFEGVEVLLGIQETGPGLFTNSADYRAGAWMLNGGLSLD